MTLREFRRADAGRFLELLRSEFPEEEALIGVRPDGFDRLIRRLYRGDARVVLAVLRLIHRSPYHLYVIEIDGTAAAFGQLTFASRAGFLSALVVAPEFRRRGFAGELIEAARRETARRRRPYIALHVLESNAPARALYAAAGYQPLGREVCFVHEDPSSLPFPSVRREIRTFRRSDSVRLAAIANETRPAPARSVVPVRPHDFDGRRWADRVFGAESTSWVVDQGAGAEAYVGATSSPLTAAAHLGTPIVGAAAEPRLVTSLLGTAGAWLGTKGPARILVNVPEENSLARQALGEVGFREAVAYLTLYRSSA